MRYFASFNVPEKADTNMEVDRSLVNDLGYNALELKNTFAFLFYWCRSIARGLHCRHGDIWG